MPVWVALLMTVPSFAYVPSAQIFTSTVHFDISVTHFWSYLCYTGKARTFKQVRIAVDFLWSVGRCEYCFGFHFKHDYKQIISSTEKKKTYFRGTSGSWTTQLNYSQYELGWQMKELLSKTWYIYNFKHRQHSPYHGFKYWLNTM
jgi:hypothetical protein